jgi:hypothetical protein
MVTRKSSEGKIRYDRAIDLIEEQAGKLCGYEIKWNQGRAKAPKDWHKYYPTAGFEVIHHENYLNYILKQSDER